MAIDYRILADLPQAYQRGYMGAQKQHLYDLSIQGKQRGMQEREALKQLLATRQPGEDYGSLVQRGANMGVDPGSLFKLEGLRLAKQRTRALTEAAAAKQAALERQRAIENQRKQQELVLKKKTAELKQGWNQLNVAAKQGDQAAFYGIAAALAKKHPDVFKHVANIKLDKGVAVAEMKDIPVKKGQRIDELNFTAPADGFLSWTVKGDKPQHPVFRAAKPGSDPTQWKPQQVAAEIGKLTNALIRLEQGGTLMDPGLKAMYMEKFGKPLDEGDSEAMDKMKALLQHRLAYFQKLEREMGGPGAPSAGPDFSGVSIRGAQGAPTLPGQAAPQQQILQTATDAQGNKIGWNGTAWVPIR